MLKILRHCMNFVPTYSADGWLHLPSGSEEKYDECRFHSILLKATKISNLCKSHSKLISPQLDTLPRPQPGLQAFPDMAAITAFLEKVYFQRCFQD